MSRGRCRRLLPVVLLAPVWVAAAGPEAGADASRDEVALHYQAFLLGAPVGEAVVSITLEGRQYRVEGTARSNGLLEGFTDWRNRFSARGRLDGGTRQPREFSYTETDRDKQRHVVVRDGTLQVIKNGKRRPPRPAPAGPDVVSALFAQPSCGGDQVVHTGRHVYRLSRLERQSGRCRYRVVDDDDDSFEIELVLVRRNGLTVPGKITFRSWMTGSIELREGR